MTKTKARSRSPLLSRGPGEVLPPYRFGGGGDESSPHDPANAVRWGMWLFLLAITMMFGALAAIYLFRLPARADFPFELPKISWFSTAVILLSSVSMQFALHAARQGRLAGLRSGLLLTFALGWLFLAFQLISWSVIKGQIEMNLFSGLFYLFTGLHGLHLLGGLVFLAYLLYRAMRTTGRVENLLPFEMGTLYWHFLGALWVALFALMHVR